MMKMVSHYLIFKVALKYSDIYDAYAVRYAIFGRSPVNWMPRSHYILGDNKGHE